MALLTRSILAIHADDGHANRTLVENPAEVFFALRDGDGRALLLGDIADEDRDGFRARVSAQLEPDALGFGQSVECQEFLLLQAPAAGAWRARP